MLSADGATPSERRLASSARKRASKRSASSRSASLQLEPLALRQSREREQQLARGGRVQCCFARAGSAGACLVRKTCGQAGRGVIGRRDALARRPPGQALRAGERGQRLGHAVERGGLRPATRRAFLRLEPVPVLDDGARVGRLGVGEDVGVPADQLGADPLRHVVDGEVPCVLRDLRVQEDLHEQVAQLLAQRLAVLVVQRLQDLVGLLQQVRAQCAVVLLQVPRAATLRVAHARDHAPQSGEVVPYLLRGHGRQG